MRAERGLTILEMLIVVTIVSLMVGLTFPSVNSGLDSLRLRSAADSVAAFLSLAMARVERVQAPVEISIDSSRGLMELNSPNPKFVRRLQLDNGVFISRVLPELHLAGEETARSVVLAPGENFPRIAIELANSRGQRRIVRIDPLSSATVVEIPPENVSTEER